MSVYTCDVLDDEGRKLTVKKEAGDRRLLFELFQKDGLYLIKIHPIEKLTKKYTGLRHAVPQKELLTFYRQVAIMLRTGGKINEAIAALQNRKSFCRTFRKILHDIYIAILSGFSFSRALSRHRKTFPSEFIKMVEVGENSGALSKIMATTADYYERRWKLNRDVSNATAYPKILVLAIFVVIAFIMFLVLPIFEKSVSSLVELPATTKFLFACSDFMTANWLYFMIGAGATACIISALFLSKPGKYILSSIEMYFPGINKLYRTLAASQFCGAFYILYSNGLTIPDSLDCVSGMSGNFAYEKKFRYISANVKAGRSIHTSVALTRLFPQLLIDLIRIGENCSGLAEALKAASETFENDTINVAKRMSSRLEPALIIIIGIIVVFVAFSVFEPMISVYNSFY